MCSDIDMSFPDMEMEVYFSWPLPVEMLVEMCLPLPIGR